LMVYQVIKTLTYKITKKHKSNMYQITDSEFNTLKELVLKTLGIRLSDSKKVLVISRFSSKLRELKINTFQEYISYLNKCAEPAREMEDLINRITTNETSFFREFKHFEYMTEVLLPHIQNEKKTLSDSKEMRIWSSACSSGEEPYSIAMTMSEYNEHNPTIKFKILATDVNTEVLEEAYHGIYDEKNLGKHVHANKYYKYFDRLSGGKIKVKDNIKSKISFRKLNLMDQRYPIKEQMDLIFCRNVMIYFSEEMKSHVLKMFHNYLKDTGTLFVGHSENLFMYKDIYKFQQNTIYSKVF